MTIHPLFRRGLFAALLALISPSAALAQLYVWRDPAGNLVLSDKRKDPSAATYGIAPGVAFRTTKPMHPRAAQYQSLIEEHAAQNAVSPDLVRAVIQAESAFNPRARSPKGAMGLMQLMPRTAAELGVIDPYDPGENIRGGVSYLRQLLDEYDGQIELALAAYNAGPGAVRKYGGNVPPYKETRAYVAKISGDVKSSGTVGQSPGHSTNTRIYRVIEIVDGKEVARYTSKPTNGSERITAVERR